MTLLTKQQQELYENSKIFFILKKKKKKEKKNFEDKCYCKIRDHCHYAGEPRAAAHSTYNLKFSVPKEISIVLYQKSYQKKLKDSLLV